MERVYRHSTLALSVAICLLGVAMTVTTLARGGGALALGVVTGVGFAVFGAGRAYLAVRSAPPPSR